MGYFAFLTDQAFRTSPTGERLYYPGGPWSRPFVITSEATELKLRKRTIWLLALSLGPIFIGMPILGMVHPSSMLDTRVLIGLLTGGLILQYVLRTLLFRTTLKQLNRFASSTPVSDYYRSRAESQSVPGLGFGLLLSLLLMANAALMYGRSPVISILCVGLFGYFSVGWGYTFFLKIRSAL